MSANLINVTLNTGNNLAASQRPRRQDSYQQAMGSMDSGKAIYTSLDDKTLFACNIQLSQCVDEESNKSLEDKEETFAGW